MAAFEDLIALMEIFPSSIAARSLVAGREHFQHGNDFACFGLMNF